MIPRSIKTIDITNCKELLCDHHKQVLNYLSRQYAVHCRTYNKNHRVILEVSSQESDDAVDIFLNQLQTIVNHPENYKRELKIRQEKNLIHIFVDISNVEIGSKKLYDGTLDFSVRLDIEKMMEIVVNMRGVSHQLAVGSVASEQAQSQFNRWDRVGFEMRILQRLPNGKEQAVDEVLHAAIQQDIVKQFATEHTLIVLTGDGNNNNNGTSFPEIIQLALDRWKVEIWGWRTSMSNVYKKFLENYGSKFSLHYFDDYKDTIVFYQDNNRDNNTNYKGKTTSYNNNKNGGQSGNFKSNADKSSCSSSNSNSNSSTNNNFSNNGHFYNNNRSDYYSCSKVQTRPKDRKRVV
jgi:hypothetical protein